MRLSFRTSGATRGVGALLVALASGSGGCVSFLGVSGPPADHRERPAFACTESYASPIIDTVLAAAGTTLTVGIAGVGQALGSVHYDRLAILAVGTVVLPTASAVYGYSKVGECRDAQSEAMRRPSLPPPGVRPPQMTPPVPPAATIKTSAADAPPTAR
jgi:hypothetical protein